MGHSQNWYLKKPHILGFGVQNGVKASYIRLYRTGIMGREYGTLKKVIVDSTTKGAEPHEFEGVESITMSELSEPAPEGSFEDENHPGGPADLIAEVDAVCVEEDGKPVEGSGKGIQRVTGNTGNMRKFDSRTGKWI
jgi:hypothetical protein